MRIDLGQLDWLDDDTRPDRHDTDGVLDLQLCRLVEDLAAIESRHADLLGPDDLARLRAASQGVQGVFQRHVIDRVSRLRNASPTHCNERTA